MSTLHVIQHDAQQIETAMVAAWTEYQQADEARTAKGLEFGRLCHELRAATSAQGSRTGGGFNEALDRIGVKRSTAYKWLLRYETEVLRLPVDEVEVSEPEPEPEPEQPKTERQRQRAEAHKVRMIKALSMMKGLCRGLADEIDLDRVLSACDESERQEWGDFALEISRTVKDFAGRLHGSKKGLRLVR